MESQDPSHGQDYLAREAKARVQIDKQLAAAGWVVQSQQALNLGAGPGVAVREFTLEKPHGRVDYLLFLNGQPTGVIEAKPEGTPLVEVERQSGKYVAGLPEWMKPPVYPLPFIYESTGAEIRFTNGYDVDARSRRVFTFHRPETLVEWSRQITDNHALPTFRARLKAMPPLDERGLWGKQAEAIRNLEQSLAEDRPRSLIQMATGSGKTFTAASLCYRLIKQADAKRVLFLVDRSNLGKQAKLEFDKFTIQETQRKFPAEYNVQHLTHNAIDTTARVCIFTIQRIFSVLKGEAELDLEIDEHSVYELPVAEPVEVSYNAALPPDAFDVIIIDECHRSIYGLWRQVLEYFDAHLIGLTAIPTKQTLGFFRQNLVMEYSHDMAVTDGVNVDFIVYKVETAITKAGSTIEAGEFAGYRDRQTRKVRWDAVDEPIEYTAGQLDRAVVAEDQIRTVIRTFRDKLFTELFPGRRTVPKTLIFAKDDSHADDIVQVVREVFGKGNQFATKITYRTRDGKPEDLLQAFRNSMYPRIVVTVDMIATGTDVKPLECLLFMRSVKSRTYFEQMLGRGVRVINDTEFQAVTDDAKSKDRFIVVDAVGVMDTPLAETVQPLERKPAQSLKDLFEQVAFGSKDPQAASSIAGRLARLDKHLTKDDRDMLTGLAGGTDLGTIARRLVDALDPDQQVAATEAAGQPRDDQSSVAATASAMLTRALEPLAANPALRNAILDVRKSYEQTIDEVSKDEVLFAGHSAEARERASALVSSFREYIEEHKNDIRALQVLYSRPHKERLTFTEIKELARVIERPPRQWTPDILWRAYELLDQSKVRGSGGRTLTDIVALVRYTLHHDDELVPFRDQVERPDLGADLAATCRLRRQRQPAAVLPRSHGMMTTCPPAVSFNSRYARPSPASAPPQHFPQGRRDGPARPDHGQPARLASPPGTDDPGKDEHDNPPTGQDRLMRYVELRRHTDNEGDRLTPQGAAEAEVIGRDRLHPPYAAFVSTGAARATQMLEILRHAAGQDDTPITPATGLRSSAEDRWRQAARAAGKGADLDAIRAIDPDLVQRESLLLASALRQVVDGLPDGARALVVGHSPTNEAAVLGLAGRVVPPLGKGKGVLLIEDGGDYRVEPLD